MYNQIMNWYGIIQVEAMVGIETSGAGPNLEFGVDEKNGPLHAEKPSVTK